MESRVGRLSPLACILAALPLGAVQIHVGVQPLVGQSTISLAVSHVPVAEPLAALEMVVEVEPPREVTQVVAEAPQLGAWSQVAPDVRQVLGGFSVCALAPSVLASRDTARAPVMNVQFTVKGTNPGESYQDIVRSIRFATMLDPQANPLPSIPAEVTTDVQNAPLRAERPLFSQRILGRQYSLTFRLLEDAQVRVILLDLSGRTVARLLNTKLAKGMHTMRCQLNTASNLPLVPGTYFLHARIGTTTISKKVRYVR